MARNIWSYEKSLHRLWILNPGEQIQKAPTLALGLWKPGSEEGTPMCVEPSGLHK